MKNTILVLAIVMLLAAGWMLIRQQRQLDSLAPSSEPSPNLEATASPSESSVIQIDRPVAGDTITSPLMVSGVARGPWYFEASFPVFLIDEQGTVIAQGVATAETEWMTEDFVPFQAELVFEKPTVGARGTLLLKRSNPSGLPENDQQFELPVDFK